MSEEVIIKIGDIIYVQILGATWSKAKLLYCDKGFLRFENMVEGRHYGNIIETTERYIITKLQEFNEKTKEY